MMNGLIDMLKGGNHSLVIAKGGERHVFDTRGIATLLQLVTDESPVMQGATIADKVVGKAAAALMIAGGAKAVHALLISDGAIKLLRDAGVAAGYEERTDHIMNRTASGWCPMELACRNCRTAGECITAIRNTIENMKKNKQ